MPGEEFVPVHYRGLVNIERIVPGARIVDYLKPLKATCDLILPQCGEARFLHLRSALPEAAVERKMLASGREAITQFESEFSRILT